MRRTRIGALGACAIILGACSGAADTVDNPTRSTKGPFDYRLTLLMDSSQVYGCHTDGNLYCRTTVPDSARDSLAVHIPIAATDTATATWLQPSGLHPPLPAFAAIALRGAGRAAEPGTVSFSGDDRYAGYCNAFSLTGSDVGGEVTGTFVQQTDCHGALRWGHFTGHR